MEEHTPCHCRVKELGEDTSLVRIDHYKLNLIISDKLLKRCV